MTRTAPLSRKPTSGSVNDPTRHSWQVSPKEAVSIQRRLASRVMRENRFDQVRRIAGADVSIKAGVARAVVAVLELPDLNLLEYARAEQEVTFPYIPGLLTFREGPVITHAIEKLTERPDLIVFDGQGIAHPRRLGIASHIGVLADIPTIGCAKSRLCGRHEEPGMEKGDFSLLKDGLEIIGAVVRTRREVKPVYVSIGHRINLESSIGYILACATRFRLPETTRFAHRLAGES